MLLTIVSINSAYAQSEAAPEKIQNQYSAEDLELLRSKMLELLDTVQEFSGTIIPNDAHSAERLQAARKQLEQFTLKDLSALRASINPSKMNRDLEQARATLNEFKPSIEAYNNNKRSRISATGGTKEWSDLALNSPLPGIEGPDAVCQALVGSGRPSSAVVIAADAVYFAAKVLDIALNRGCNQVLVAGAVVLGEGVIAGANTSTACIVSDGILFAAEQVRDKVASCNDDFTKRSVDAAVKRMETIHTDLESSVANDDANKNTIVANDNTNTASIIANANANKVELIRLHIAADLASTDSSTLVGAFMLPATQGGYLELVRAVVVQMISGLAGSSTSQANSSLAQGDTYKNAGDYKNAYTSYRKAYKIAVK